MLKNVIDICIRQGSGPHLQSVIKRPVKQVYHRVRVNIRSEESLLHTFAEVFHCHLPSRHRPAIMQSFRQFRIKLRLRKESTNNRPIFTAKGFAHSPHLKADAFFERDRRSKQSSWVHSFDERVHDDGCFIGPASVHSHATHSSLFSNSVDAQATETTAQHQVDRSLENGSMKLCAPRSSPRGKSYLVAPVIVDHNALNFL